MNDEEHRTIDDRFEILEVWRRPLIGDGSAAVRVLAKVEAGAYGPEEYAVGISTRPETVRLGWRPGVRTARFAGADASDGENLHKLHREAPAGSRARYVCVIAYVTPDGAEHLFEGRCEGTLAEQPHGAGGFGYDPIFVADETPGRTMAELADDEKDAISHRGHAARGLLEWLGTR